VEDVADAFVRSLDRAISYSKSYSLCGPRSYTFNELVDLLIRMKKVTRLKFHIPLGLLKAPAFLAERFFHRPPLTRDQLKMLQEDNICSDHEASKELGIEFKGVEEILPRYIH
jgi:NADH dehydrogenase